MRAGIVVNVSSFGSCDTESERQNELDKGEACAREPIHVPGTIQSHGHLLAFEGPDLLLVHASAAAAGEVLPADLEDAFGAPFKRVFQADSSVMLRDCLLELPECGSLQLGSCRSRTTGVAFQVIAHRSPQGLAILELEALPAESAETAGIDVATLEGLYPLIRDAFDRLGSVRTIEEVLAVAAHETRRITGFDRVMIYRFEENWDGIVVAEDRNDRLPSYLDLRFPASDIPAQARQLYATNRLRLIADANSTAVPVLPQRHPGNGQLLDLSFAALRSVSPVHLDYMRNMGTPASMSVSLLRGDRLWGLISCHHTEPRRVSFAVRAACDLIGQMLAARIAAREETAYAEERTRLKTIESRLLAHMAAAQGDLAEGLAGAPSELCALAGAAGAAVLTSGGCILVGRTPPEADVRHLADWLQQQNIENAFETHALGTVMPTTEALSDNACGMLAIPISRLHPSFVLWFRPEVVRTVTWGGDPRESSKATSSNTVSKIGRLSPRYSFEAWKETVRGTSVSWSAAHMEAARDLRSAIVGVVLRHAEERAELTGRLERINAELSAFSYSVSHDLRAPFRHITGYAELLLERENERLDDKSRHFVATIIESAQTAGLLVDALLNFSRMGRDSLTPIETDPNLLVREAVRRLALEARDRQIEWRIGPLPIVRADPVMLRQVIQNLLSNALKYTNHRANAVIDVSCDTTSDVEFMFAVHDNGVGFDMAYARKLFGVFQRLHRVEDYEGVGIGLAIVRRIIERHGGRTWAEGALDQGATFYFSLPRNEPPPEKE